MEVTWVSEDIALSGVIDDYSLLDKFDIVINCKKEKHDDIEKLTDMGISYFWIPMFDGDAPTIHQMDVCLSIMRVNLGQRILVHCNEGRGRSAVMVMAYLVVTFGYTVDEAFNLVVKKRPIVGLRQPQRARLNEYFKRGKK